MSPLLNRNRHQQMTPVEHQMKQMWQLAADGRSLRLSLPGLPVALTSRLASSTKLSSA
jgi:hypothetical protein